MQIANETIGYPAVRGTIDRLAAEISAVREAEAAAIKHRAEQQAALRREARQFEENTHAALDSRVYSLNEDHRGEVEQAEALVAGRTAWAQNAYHAAKASMSQRIQARKDSKVGQAQGEIMRSRQQRQSVYDEAAAEHAALVAKVEEFRSERRTLRQQAMGAMSTFKPLVASSFTGRKPFPNPDEPASAAAALDALAPQIERVKSAVASVRGLPLPKLFRFLPLWLIASVIAGAHVWLGLRAGGGGLREVLPSLLISEGVLMVVWIAALATSWSPMQRAARAISDARFLETSAAKLSSKRLGELDAEMKEIEAADSQRLGETFRSSDHEWRSLIAEGNQKLDERLNQLPSALERMRDRLFGRIQTAHEARVSAARGESDAAIAGFAAQQDKTKQALEDEFGSKVDALLETWNTSVVPLANEIRELARHSRERFPAWTTAACENWQVPADSPTAVRVGDLPLDLTKFAGGLPSDPRFSATLGENFDAPFSLAFPEPASVLIETDGSDESAGARALHAVALRLVASLQPGRSSFLFIDPVGLGKDFAGLMHLADYEETLIHHRIWTQNTHIEERLAEVNEHIEKVIQMYLRDEYADITAYNEQAGVIAEKYHFVVIAGFPSNFSDTALKRLHSIATSGARCGVYLLIQRDLRVALAEKAIEDELRRVCIRIEFRKGVFHLTNAKPGADTLAFDTAPADATELVHRIGRASVDSNRVEVPFAHIAPEPGSEWMLDTSDELRIPVGRTGARKLQTLAIGKGTRQHVLVAGKTGSGKSTLFHVIVTNLALWASPGQVEFYLVDFKKGVEFKCYASKRLPHAKVVAIESDREFALSVLQRVDGELKRRGELFRKAGAQDLSGYRKTAGSEPMPRSLLLIDEFQEFFTEDDAVAQEASLLLDRIVRQGRAFGIHVILGSQTLGGAYTLARATLGQMVIRIALQCNETDAHLIMDEDNPAPRLLTRPGEGIYNDQAGAVAANSPFQIVWLPESERDTALDRAASLAKRDGIAAEPIVFEGNAPADVRDNPDLAAFLHNPVAARPRVAKAWLGAPNSIKGHTEAAFQRLSGSHLLVIGQSGERTSTILALSLLSLASQFPADQANFVVLDPHGSEPDPNSVFHRLAALLPHEIKIGGPAEVADLMTGLHQDLTGRSADAGRNAPETFLLVHEIQRFKALRPEDEFRFSMDDEESAASPSKVFSDILGEGAPSGIHVLASVDTWNNVSRWIPRKMLSEFEMRVLFQMSANDSANLIDSPAATQLGLHRALFYNEHLGTLETFRPYAMPEDAWFEETLGGRVPT
ncbi:MAG: AAA family ATPase [Akkermansiaceae bacterium]|nr:AAA family ATPase [Akkermansiaceae bacterium]